MNVKYHDPRKSKYVAASIMILFALLHLSGIHYSIAAAFSSAESIVYTYILGLPDTSALYENYSNLKILELLLALF